MRSHILILGGTYESRLLAEHLAPRRDLDITLSLAGRTKNPAPQPVPSRSGGFGGADGLARYLTEHNIRLMIDATHPFARRISANAIAAARQTGTAFFALRRPPWQPVEGDRWREAETVREALTMAGERPQRIFVALGRQELAPLLSAPAHHYVIRSVDPVEPPLDLPHVTALLARGPFFEAAETELLRRHKIDLIIAKNSGGPASRAKLDAARTLNIPVILVKRPQVGEAPCVATINEAVKMLDHFLLPS